MIIDFHTHLFPEKIADKTIELLAKRSGITPFSTGEAKGLLHSMEEGNVSVSVVLPVVTNPEQFSSILRFATTINEQYGIGEHRMLSFGGIHPDSVTYKEELRQLKEAGFVGIKLHPDYQGVFIDDIRYMRVIEEASRLGLIVSVHAGVDVGLPEVVHCPPLRALEMIKQVQPEKLILAHLGGWKQWDEVEEYLVGQKVWFDTAVSFGYCSDEQLCRIIREHGADRILFATDSPWSGQKESIEYLKNLGLSLEEQEWILHKSGEALLGM